MHFNACTEWCKGWPCFVPQLWQTFSLFQSNQPYNCILHSRIGNVFLFFEQPAKARRTCRKRVWNHMWTAVIKVQGLTNFRVPFLFQGCHSRNQHWRNSNIFCHVNQAGLAQNYWPACQNFGVLCPKWMSCEKHPFISLQLLNKCHRSSPQSDQRPAQ